MRLPGFVAEESLYRTRAAYRQGTSATLGVGPFAVRAQWDTCTDCNAAGLKYCCDLLHPGEGGCAWVTCCTPGCSACMFNASGGGGGSYDCWDAACRPLGAHPCPFCAFNLGYDACYSDCFSRCAQSDPDCSTNCDCCCQAKFAAGRCGCVNGVMVNGRCVRG
jgi:hypothetical protein